MFLDKLGLNLNCLNSEAVQQLFMFVCGLSICANVDQPRVTE